MVKKLLFVLTVIRMDQDSVLRRILVCRLCTFIEKRDSCRKNSTRSPIFDILNVAITFGLFETIKNMVLSGEKIMSKKGWSKLVWERVWYLEDSNWRAANTILKDNDLLSMVMGDTKYLSWWYLSDMDYKCTKMCETMSKLICHASRLKQDDYRLKGLPMSNRTCVLCDMYCIESIVHIVNQCPFYCRERTAMYDRIYEKCPNAENAFKNDPQYIPYYMLGRRIQNFEENEMIWLWRISGE